MERLKWYIDVSPGLPSAAAVPSVARCASVCRTRENSNVDFVDFALRRRPGQKPGEFGERRFHALMPNRGHPEGLGRLQVSAQVVDEDAAVGGQPELSQREL